MESSYLQSTILEIEFLNKVFKAVPTFSNNFTGLLLGQDLLVVFIWLFKVWEKQNENFIGVFGYLNKINHCLNHVEVSI